VCFDGSFGFKTPRFPEIDSSERGPLTFEPALYPNMDGGGNGGGGGGGGDDDDDDDFPSTGNPLLPPSQSKKQ